MKCGARMLPAIAALLLAPPSAQAEKLIVSLSSEIVEIRSNFTGAQIALFGSIMADDTRAPAGAYDIVATTRGPRGVVTVFEKRKFGPFWLNGDRRTLADVPSFMSVLSNRPLDRIASPQTRTEERLGLDRATEQQAGVDAGASSYRDALVRLRSAHQLFHEGAGSVRFLAPTLFQATIPVAGTAPLGRYNVEVKAFLDGALVAQAQTSFDVEKRGAEQWISQTAHTDGFVYGLALSLIALSAGWLASVVFRRE